VIFDLIGVLGRRPNLFEASFWNLIVAGHRDARDVLNRHSTLDWSLARVLAVITG